MIDVVMIVIGLMIVVIGWVIVAQIQSYARSVKYSVQYGMVFDRKSRQLMGTETEILIDEKTGRKWLGKTRVLV
jgi:hypothetical protein